MSTRVCFAGVGKHYLASKGRVEAVRDFNVDVSPGEFLSIVGPSGCGKSTVLKMAAGLLSPSTGSIVMDGKPVEGPQIQLGVVFQEPTLLPWRTVLGNLMLQTEGRRRDASVRMNRTQAENRARRLLEQVGLDGFEDSYPHELSGGMQQRVAICRALLHEPGMILFDEPFGALDALTREQLMLDLHKLCADQGTTVLFITHSISEAVFLSSRVVVMTPRPGRIDQIVDIDLPARRTLAIQSTPQFGGHVLHISNLFVRSGVLADTDNATGKLAVADGADTIIAGSA